MFRWVVLCIVLASCSGSDPKVEDIGPRIDEGLYSYQGQATGAENLPLVAIVKDDGKTYAYSYFSYQCDSDSPITSSFRKSGTTFSDNPVAAGGPNVKVLGQSCSIETDIEADSTETIKIRVRVEGSPEVEYLLTKTSEDSFKTSLDSLIDGSDRFQVDEEACQAVFGSSCQEINLADKEAEEE